MVDDEGNRIEGKSHTVGKDGTIGIIHRKTINKKPSIIMEVSGDKKAAALFEFLAQNTSVEWSHVKYGSRKSGKNAVGTTHQTDKTAIASALAKLNLNMREVNHNHPGGNDSPSDADRSVAAHFEKKYKRIIKQHIYTYKDGIGKYTAYDSRGEIRLLPKLTITP